jgi:exonuclease VII small subunit
MMEFIGKYEEFQELVERLNSVAFNLDAAEAVVRAQRHGRK